MKKAASEAIVTTVDNSKLNAAQITDESLVVSASNGDEEAFKHLFERHRFWVSRTVGKFFHRPERVEEIVQEVFTKLYCTLSYFSPQPGKTFNNWLASVAINFCYDELRKSRRRPEHSISEVTENEQAWLKEKLTDNKTSSTEHQVIVRDLANKLLSQLSAEDRLVLTLLDVEELSVSEIAELTGWSVSKVKVRAHRARIELRGLLNKFL